MEYTPGKMMFSRLAGLVAPILLVGFMPPMASADAMEYHRKTYQEFDDAQKAVVATNAEIDSIRSRIFWLETAGTLAPVGVAVAAAGSLFLVPFYPAQIATVLLVAPVIVEQTGYTNPAAEMLSEGLDFGHYPPGGEAFVRIKIFLSSAVGIGIEAAGLITNVDGYFRDRLSEARQELSETVKLQAESRRRFDLAQRRLSVLMRGMDNADRIIPWEELIRKSFAHSPAIGFGSAAPSGGTYTVRGYEMDSNGNWNHVSTTLLPR